MAMQHARLLEAFTAFAGGAAEMDGRAFAKCLRDAGLISRALPLADADLIFLKRSRARSGRKIGFDEFLAALEEVAVRRGDHVEHVLHLVNDTTGPMYFPCTSTVAAPRVAASVYKRCMRRKGSDSLSHAASSLDQTLHSLSSEDAIHAVELHADAMLDFLEAGWGHAKEQSETCAQGGASVSPHPLPTLLESRSRSTERLLDAGVPLKREQAPGTPPSKATVAAGRGLEPTEVPSPPIAAHPSLEPRPVAAPTAAHQPTPPALAPPKLAPPAGSACRGQLAEVGSTPPGCAQDSTGKHYAAWREIVEANAGAAGSAERLSRSWNEQLLHDEQRLTASCDSACWPTPTWMVRPPVTSQMVRPPVTHQACAHPSPPHVTRSAPVSPVPAYRALECIVEEVLAQDVSQPPAVMSWSPATPVPLCRELAYIIEEAASLTPPTRLPPPLTVMSVGSASAPSTPVLEARDLMAGIAEEAAWLQRRALAMQGRSLSAPSLRSNQRHQREQRPSPSLLVRSLRPRRDQRPPRLPHGFQAGAVTQQRG